jgi:hypothetical protein
MKSIFEREWKGLNVMEFSFDWDMESRGKGLETRQEWQERQGMSEGIQKGDHCTEVIC